jgi:hypothetical protein
MQGRSNVRCKYFMWHKGAANETSHGKFFNQCFAIVSPIWVRPTIATLIASKFASLLIKIKFKKTFVAFTAQDPKPKTGVISGRLAEAPMNGVLAVIPASIPT